MSAAPKKHLLVGLTPYIFRRLQVSLRLFLLVVLVFALWLGWIVRRVHQQRDAVATITRIGGKVSFDAQEKNMPGLPSSIKPYVIDYFFLSVVAVDMSFLEFNEDDLAQLGTLTGLRTLNLAGASINDAGLTKLR